MTQLPKELRRPAADLIEHATFQTVLKVLKDRTPAHPDPKMPPHEQAAQAFLRQGYEKALDELVSLPYEVDSDEDSPLKHMLDPKD